MKPDVTAFFDNATNTISFVVKDPAGTSCAIIDSVLDFDYFYWLICLVTKLMPHTNRDIYFLMF